MSETTRAKGSATRTANMVKRRARILACAGDIIAKDGVEALTLERLAKAAKVTIPTINNLIGPKNQIFVRLVEQLVAHIDSLVLEHDTDDPIEVVESIVTNLIELYRSNESFYKAAFVVGERIKLFDHGQPEGLNRRSFAIAKSVCADAVTRGFLRGDIGSDALAEHLFGNHRLSRQDWINGYIDLSTYRTRALRGMFITLAADATPSFRARLLERIAQLGPPEIA